MSVETTEILYTRPHKITFDWVSDGAGDATGSTTAAGLVGLLVRAVFVPDGPTTQPLDLHDIVINDSDGTDILHGNGANLSNVAVTLKDQTDGLGAVVNSSLTLVVSAAGAVKGGSVHLYLK